MDDLKLPFGVVKCRFADGDPVSGEKSPFVVVVVESRVGDAEASENA